MIVVRMAREHSSVRGFAPEEMYKVIGRWLKIQNKKKNIGKD